MQTTGRPVLQGDKDGNLFNVTIPIQPISDGDGGEYALVSDVKPSNNYELWHRRFGHPSTTVLKQMLGGGVVDGMSFTKQEIKDFHAKGICEGCAKGKMDKLPVSRQPSKVDAKHKYKPGQRMCSLAQINLLEVIIIL